MFLSIRASYFAKLRENCASIANVTYKKNATCAGARSKLRHCMYTYNCTHTIALTIMYNLVVDRMYINIYKNYKLCTPICSLSCTIYSLSMNRKYCLCTQKYTINPPQYTNFRFKTHNQTYNNTLSDVQSETTKMRG
jgi:hypothetical protein